MVLEESLAPSVAQSIMIGINSLPNRMKRNIIYWLTVCFQYGKRSFSSNKSVKANEEIGDGDDEMHMTAFGIFDLHLQAENLAFVESGYRADIQLITSNEMEQL